VYAKPSSQRPKAKPGLPAISSTVGGAVNMPVPIILFMIKDAHPTLQGVKLASQQAPRTVQIAHGDASGWLLVPFEVDVVRWATPAIGAEPETMTDPLASMSSGVPCCSRLRPCRLLLGNSCDSPISLYDSATTKFVRTKEE
jgi:hypothetical protein